MTKCLKVDIKRSICNTNSNYEYSIWSGTDVVILNTNSKEMLSFNVGDFIALDENKRIVRVIKKEHRKKGSKSVRLKK